MPFLPDSFPASRWRAFSASARHAALVFFSKRPSRPLDQELSQHLLALVFDERLDELREALGSAASRALAGAALRNALSKIRISADPLPLRALLSQGVNPDRVGLNRMGLRPLMSACRAGEALAAIELLPHSAVNAPDERGAGALAYAAARGPERLARALLDAGANPNQADCHGMGPLEMAAISGQLEIMRLLLDRGAALNDPKGSSARALAAALLMGREPEARLLIELGAALDGSASWPAIERLIDQPLGLGRPPKLLSGDLLLERAGPAHWAAAHGLESMIELLLERSPGSLDAPAPLRKGSSTPLAFAILAGREGSAFALLRAGADPSLALPEGFLSLSELAADHGHAGLAKRLAQAAPLSQPQIDAFWRRRPHLADRLLPDSSRPSDVNALSGGLSIFHRSLFDNANPEFLARLLELGADPLAPAGEEYDAMDALMLCSGRCPDPRMPPALIALGLDPLRRDRNGLRALDHALIDPIILSSGSTPHPVFEALANAMIDLPGGPEAIAEALSDDRFEGMSEEASELAPLLRSRWLPLAFARQERDALRRETQGAAAPGPRRQIRRV